MTKRFRDRWKVKLYYMACYYGFIGWVIKVKGKNPFKWFNKELIKHNLIFFCGHQVVKQMLFNVTIFHSLFLYIVSFTLFSYSFVVANLLTFQAIRSRFPTTIENIIQT